MMGVFFMAGNRGKTKSARQNARDEEALAPEGKAAGLSMALGGKGQELGVQAIAAVFSSKNLELFPHFPWAMLRGLTGSKE
jgi:hypothetical protein